MNILIPRNTFLRVADKYVPEFIDHDKTVASNPTLLYKKLYACAYDTGMCTVPQKFLSEQCKYSLRSVQYALRRLCDLDYIRVESNPGGYSTYVLLLSRHVRQLLKAYDLITRPEKHARPAPATPSTAAAPAAPAVTTPPQTVQGGYAKPAHPSYNEDKKDKKTSPSTPLPTVQPGNSVPATPGRGNISLLAGKNTALLIQAFERLWNVWPVRQARHEALRVFCALARAGRLPSLETLLEAVARLSAQDDRWRRGYAPHLVNWLRGQRWCDEPVMRAGETHENSQASLSVAAASTSHPVVHAAHLPDKTELPELPTALVREVEHLCALWPDAPWSPVRAFFRTLLRQNRMSAVEAVIAQAKQHLRETTKPVALTTWLLEQQRSFAA